MSPTIRMSKYWTHYIIEGNVAGAMASQRNYGRSRISFPLIADAKSDLLKLVDDLIKEDITFLYPEIIATIDSDIKYPYHKYRAINGIKILLYLLNKNDKDILVMEDEWYADPSEFLEAIYTFMRENRDDIIKILSELSTRINLVSSRPITAFLANAFGPEEVPQIIADAIGRKGFNRRKHLLTTFKVAGGLRKKKRTTRKKTQ
jgi:hypothetical protein